MTRFLVVRKYKFYGWPPASKWSAGCLSILASRTYNIVSDLSLITYYKYLGWKLKLQTLWFPYLISAIGIRPVTIRAYHFNFRFLLKKNYSSAHIVAPPWHIR